MIKPDFQNGILNLSATLADFLGDKNDIPKLKILQDELKTAPTRVVFIIFDGLGVHNVKQLTGNNNYYLSHIASTLSSTMPATTTCATTTLASTLYPDQHLWLAWSLWLNQQQRVVEIYLSTDYHTKEKTEKYNQPVQNFIDRANTNKKITTIAPIYAHYSNKIEAKVAGGVEELFNQINQQLSNDGEQFIYCYCDEPDHSMHDLGVNSQKVKTIFAKIQTGLKDLVENNKDLLVITTADHGHINVKDYIHIQADKDIMAMQERPISMEPRFASFKIKDGLQKDFYNLFTKKYGKYFYLISKEEVFKQGIFGTGQNREKVEDFIGDYIAIGNDTFYGIDMFETPRELLKGLHAGATLQEMQVPLCIFKSKK